mmetsp:Transcript_58729/g.93363  ORF Transcript_58729/g.93363 Transcript_58729/m.93363 type:complete len:235 (-) Transcript_58729:223-927(-)
MSCFKTQIILQMLFVLFAFISITKSKRHQNLYCKTTDQFRFAKKRPSKQSLAVCKQYNQQTCCSPADSYTIFKRMQPYLQNEDISMQCKELTMDMLCSSCHPQIGTHEKTGICIDTCDKWYDACLDEYYYMDVYGQLNLCQPDSLICAPLRTFIRDGSQFCRTSGFESNHIAIDCFAGNSRLTAPSTASTKPRKLITDSVSDQQEQPSITPSISSSDAHLFNYHAIPSLQSLHF